MATLNRRCRECGENDVTVQSRPGTFRVLCVSCYCTLRAGSTVKAQAVPETVQQDRYAQMAAKYGL